MEKALIWYLVTDITREITKCKIACIIEKVNIAPVIVSKCNSVPYTKLQNGIQIELNRNELNGVLKLYLQVCLIVEAKVLLDLVSIANTNTVALH